jgi:ribonucleoside-diphosphate reductase alpha chain
MAGYPTRKIAEGCLKYRTLGLGYCGAGALMMRLGLPYASEASRGYVAAITALMHFQCGATSAEMASHFGTFPRFPANAADMHRVVANHVAATTNNQPFDGLSVEPRRLTSYPVPAYLMDAVTEVAKLCQESGLRHGYRNAQWTLCAPTGTIGILMDADTTGIEPDFSLVKFKMLAGGGYFKIVNQSIKPALTVMGYKEDEITEIVNYCLGVPDLATQPAFVAVLKAHGWDEQQLVDLNEKMPSLVDLRFAIKQDELLAMGLTHTEIAKLNRELCGTLTVEGAPHLREEHLAVFDCANRCGATGKRSLAAMDHLTMMAAAQPFFSGAISKTVNLPENATIDEVSRLMFSSWELMIKAVAFYRNESKLSQPLVSFMNDDQEEAMVGGSVVARVAHAAQQVIYRYISQRRRLPYRRQGYTQKFRLADHGVYLRTGEYPDGTLGEIWIDLAKQGAALRSWAGCFAIAVSLGLQHGVPLDEYIQAFVGVRFDPAGMVGNHPTIKTATSIIDMIFRELGINYLGMEDLRSVAPTEDTEVEVPEFYAERHANDMHDDEIQEWPKDEKAYSATKSVHDEAQRKLPAM